MERREREKEIETPEDSTPIGHNEFSLLPMQKEALVVINHQDTPLCRRHVDSIARLKVVYFLSPGEEFAPYVLVIKSAQTSG